MGKDATPEESAATKARMAEIFKEAVSDASRFTLVYAFDTDVSMTSFIVRTTTYTYVSYILGYDAAKPEIVLVEIDPELSQYGEALRFPREAIVKATYGSMMQEYTIRDNRLKKRYIQFSVPGITDDVELYPPILQMEESDAFNAFYLAHFAEPSDGGIMGKIKGLFGQ